MSSVLDKLKRKLMVKPEVEPYKPINIKLFNDQRKIELNEEKENVDEEGEEDKKGKVAKNKEKTKYKEDEKRKIQINDKTNLNLNRDELMNEFNKIRKELNENKKIGITLDIQKEKEMAKEDNKTKKTKTKKSQITKYKKKKIKIEEEEEEEEEEGDKKVNIPIVFENLNEKITEYEGEKENKLGEEKENMEEIEIVKKKSKKEKKTTKKDDNEKKMVMFGVENIIQIGDTPIKDRIIKNPLPNIKLSSYFLNNRKFFINFINKMFLAYRDEMENEENIVSCDNIGKISNNFSLLTHQKLIKDYLNIYTPYRGLLLFHGLGSGKTCSSIAIAEGLKTSKKIIVMLPASLKQNYIKELKKCGDYLYKRNQYWEWISIVENPQTLYTLSNVLNLPIEFIKTNKGAYLVNISKASNYDLMSNEEKNKIENQIDMMIKSKYQFINYNGIRNKNLKDLTNNYNVNIFDDSVVIIDESHNFISRIVNKIDKEKELEQDNKGNKSRLPISLSLKFYELLMSSKNSKIIMLSGTPIINYPNEIAIMYNILRGYIKTWSIPLDIENKINENEIKNIFQQEKLLDYFDYDISKKTIQITRNPFGFENKFIADNKYSGVSKFKKIKKDNVIVEEERGIISDEDFEKKILDILKRNNINVFYGQIKITNYKCLPDNLNNFISLFSLKKEEQNKKEKEEQITFKMNNSELFKKRIMGLTSYFRSAQEELLPKYDKLGDFHVIKVPMSDYQFQIYEVARQKERKQELGKKKKVNLDNIFKDASSNSYKIFSRLFCNFVLPIPPGRPMPKQEEDIIEKIEKEKIKEKVVENENKEEIIIEDYELEGDQILEENGDATYKNRINEVYSFLKENSSQYLSIEGLSIYSPKFLYMIENIKRPENIGCNLIYSQFRTLEGIGLFILTLEANGFKQFKIKKNNLGIWDLDFDENDIGKPMFALYTGTESEIEKDIIRNIYNGDWYNGDVPQNIVDKLVQVFPNNNYGEIIKILMITASGSEGINLKNTRFVHLMESYWHSVRLEQVIGRARRICSHNKLEKQFQTVEVFLYLMTFTPFQLQGDNAIELKLKDLSKLDKKTPLTTDEMLFEISNIKETFNTQIISAVKESSIDCSVYNKSNNKEGLTCLSFSNTDNISYSYTPNILEDIKDEIMKKNINIVELKGREIIINGKKYILNDETQEVYDYESYFRKNPIILGKLEKKGNKIGFKKL